MHVIFWDFDGVILDSMSIRSEGFVRVLKDYDKKEVDQLIDYHNINGGLSRYVKFRYFFEHIRGETLSESKLIKLTSQFSIIMREILSSPDLLIKDSVEFIKANYKKYKMHIVSGSDGDELRYLCEALGINEYFYSIDGSPTVKNDLVKNVLEENSYDTSKCILIGDSINDFEAAKINKINFYGYNNKSLRELDGYIENFLNFNF